jgi:hypothetical protein
MAEHSNTPCPGIRRDAPETVGGGVIAYHDGHCCRNWELKQGRDTTDNAELAARNGAAGLWVDACHGPKGRWNGATSRRFH